MVFSTKLLDTLKLVSWSAAWEVVTELVRKPKPNNTISAVEIPFCVSKYFTPFKFKFNNN